MTFRATGPGKVEIDQKYSSPGMLKALLYNFDFDDMASTTLKAAHTQFLSERVVSLLAKDRGHIWMQGSASQVGSSQYNLVLSQVRVKRVADFLQNRSISANQMQLDAVGEELASGHSRDDERDRGVAMIVLPKSKVSPPPARVIPSKPQVGDQFKIALLTAVSWSKAAKYAKYLKGKIGAGLAVDVMFFVIWDTMNSKSCIYLYSGAGIGVGLSIPLSGTTHGDWTAFKTSKPISSAQFDGPTRFTTIGVGSKSFNVIHLLGTPPGVDAVYMQIQTGTTLGGGASSTVGEMILLEGPEPFAGP